MSSKSAISGRAVTDLFQEPNDATPLEPEEKLGLKQTWITYRRDLNEAEQENIVKGAAWARSRRQRNKDVLNEDFAKLLHKRMFSDVWHWAGTHRLTERNIGIAPHRIANGMMFDDVNYWVKHTTFPADEIAVRLHHRLVAIHPLPTATVVTRA
jgi:Fic-DOC domain mobile mystery protein B